MNFLIILVTVALVATACTEPEPKTPPNACETAQDCASGFCNLSGRCGTNNNSTNNNSTNNNSTNNNSTNNNSTNNNSTNNNSTNNNSTNNGTTGNNGTIGTNNTTGTNNGTIVPNGQFAYIRVKDTTVGDGCTSRDPGSDMLWAYISDTTGTPLAFANIVDENLITEDNDFTFGTNVFTGSPPPAGLDQCPDFSLDDVLTLGCGGEVFLNFLDATSTPFTLVSGVHDVATSEYGTQCGGSADDQYSVYLCTDSIANAAGDWSSCNYLLIENATGEVYGAL